MHTPRVFYNYPGFMWCADPKFLFFKPEKRVPTESFSFIKSTHLITVLLFVFTHPKVSHYSQYRVSYEVTMNLLGM